MGQFIAVILAIRDLVSMAGKFLIFWKEKERKDAEKEIEESVDVAIDTKDQRKFEKAIGNSNAGKPTKRKLDSLQRRKRRDRS